MLAGSLNSLTHQLHEGRVGATNFVGSPQNTAVGIQQNQHRRMVVIAVGQQAVLDTERCSNLAYAGGIGACQCPARRIQLRAGDRLCMVTDGITEAANGDDALYGSARLRAALAALGVDPSADAITRHVREDVGAFVAGAEASDDLAILVLHWIGPLARP